MDTITWIGIALCVSQSAIFSGLNLAVFGVTRLRLEVESQLGNDDAKRVLQLRQDSNFLLTTILWGNVAINTLLALLAGSIMTGAVAFLFSTVLITFVGEIGPQAYFSRNALRMAALLSPVLRFYQIVLYPLAKPTALVLDVWLGKEGVQYFREHNLRAMLLRHVDAAESDIDRLEGIGALNFLALDDLLVERAGEPVDEKSIVPIPDGNGGFAFPDIERSADDPFLQQIEASGHKWVILVDENDEPVLVMDADGFLRDALFGTGPVNPESHCSRPIVVRDGKTLLGDAVTKLEVSSGADVIDRDLILVWTDKPRVITGADLLGRLLRGALPHAPVDAPRR